jgi:hypothetical protein
MKLMRFVPLGLFLLAFALATGIGILLADH